jgi:hypothetical protein
LTTQPQQLTHFARDGLRICYARRPAWPRKQQDGALASERTAAMATATQGPVTYPLLNAFTSEVAAWNLLPLAVMAAVDAFTSSSATL